MPKYPEGGCSNFRGATTSTKNGGSVDELDTILGGRDDFAFFGGSVDDH